MTGPDLPARRGELLDDLDTAAAVDGPAPLSVLDQALGMDRVIARVRALAATTHQDQLAAGLGRLLDRIESETTVRPCLPGAELDRRDGAWHAAHHLRNALDATEEANEQ